MKNTGLQYDVHLFYPSDICNVVFSFILQGQVLQCCRQAIPAQYISLQMKRGVTTIA